MKVAARDLGVLVVSSLRYALGRATYITSDTSELVERYWKYIPLNDRTVVLRDLQRHLDQSKDHDTIDNRIWVSLREKLYRELSTPSEGDKRVLAEAAIVAVSQRLAACPSDDSIEYLNLRTLYEKLRHDLATDTKR